MSSINSVTSNTALAVNDLFNIYTLASGKSHAVVDVSLFKPNSSAATFNVYITDTAIGSLTALDAVTRNMGIPTTNGSFLLEKAIVGPGQSVFIKSALGAFNARLAGVEENNTSIGSAGKLAAFLFTTGMTTPQLLYKPATLDPALVLCLCSMTAYNNGGTTASVDVYITTGTTPAPSDLVDTISIEAGKNGELANILLNPNESIFVKATPGNVNFHLNGYVQL